jgi:CRP-like cAMP-binding protein
MNGSQTVTEALLRRFSPLDGMKQENLISLARKVRISELAAGRILFRAGDTDNRAIWLVSGRLELWEGDRPIAMLRGGASETINPVSPMLPRKFTARAIDSIQYLAIDSNLLDSLLTWDQTGIYEVGELATQFGSAEELDWMTTLLLSNTFRHIPPANIQAIFVRMQRVNCRAGEVIIQQGAEGDCFYAIVSGKCGVIRETPLNREGIRLAELGLGDTFGEEALISEGKRNATVRMLTDGALMRLKKEDFLELMKDPLQQSVDYPQAQKIIERGGRWLDVRLPSEYQNLAIAGAVNIPLCFIRIKLTALDRGVPYVVYCDTGRRSSAAAFILLERGFDVYVLRGGIASANAVL